MSIRKVLTFQCEQCGKRVTLEYGHLADDITFVFSAECKCGHVTVFIAEEMEQKLRDAVCLSPLEAYEEMDSYGQVIH